MVLRALLAAAFVAAPLLATSASADSKKITPVAITPSQSTPSSTNTQQSLPTAPATGDYNSYGEGGCPFGHRKNKTAATS